VQRVILASDFHLTPLRPREMEVFLEFCREVVAGADRFYVMGDLFEAWVGPKHLKVPGYQPAFDAMRALSDGGTEVVLFRGNRDFLLGAPEAKWVGGEVVGEETVVELFGRRYLLLHGDSLCTLDVDYQKSKRWLRSGWFRFTALRLPLPLALRIAGGLRGQSKKSVSAKPREQMELAPDAVRARFEEGYDALICGHVHAPGDRDYGDEGRALPVHVLGDWHEDGGIYAEIDADGLRLQRFEPSR